MNIPKELTLAVRNKEKREQGERKEERDEERQERRQEQKHRLSEKEAFPQKLNYAYLQLVRGAVGEWKGV